LQVPEIDLSAIGRDVWKRRGLFASVVGIVLVLTIIVLHVLSTQYTVSMSVAPIVESNQQLGGGLGTLARLGGVNLNGLTGGSGQFRLFVEGLKTRDTAETLAQDPDLMHGLFATRWDDSQKQWKPQSVLSKIVRGIEAFFGVPVEPWHPPNADQVYDLLQTQLGIDDDPKEPTVSLSIQTEHPEVAAVLLSKLVHNVDETLRARALERANSYIAYLNLELQKVTVSDYRSILVEHLAEQEQTRMMASATVSFAAQTFSAPSRSNTATAPKSILLLIIALAVGIIAGAAIAVLAERRRWFVRELADGGAVRTYGS
jgi:hypothetical protein